VANQQAACCHQPAHDSFAGQSWPDAQLTRLIDPHHSSMLWLSAVLSGSVCCLVQHTCHQLIMCIVWQLSPHLYLCRASVAGCTTGWLSDQHHNPLCCFGGVAGGMQPSSLLNRRLQATPQLINNAWQQRNCGNSCWQLKQHGSSCRCAPWMMYVCSGVVPRHNELCRIWSAGVNCNKCFACCKLHAPVTVTVPPAGKLLAVCRDRTCLPTSELSAYMVLCDQRR
jgi:hypothetical protein